VTPLDGILTRLVEERITASGAIEELLIDCSEDSYAIAIAQVLALVELADKLEQLNTTVGEAPLWRLVQAIEGAPR